MRVIPTTYKGITFRSRLEANWAAYFDILGLTWSYESESYVLRAGVGYLPDFHLFQPYHYEDQLFVECKPPLQESVRKAGLFVRESGRSLLLAMPEGRFFLCTPRYADLLIRSDWPKIIDCTRRVPSLAMVGEDAIGGPYNYFWNDGEESDCYVGQPPDYFDSMKDANRPDGGDARTYYYGGYSTWQQRGFEPLRWAGS
jgi:hypothetical protein